MSFGKSSSSSGGNVWGKQSPYLEDIYSQAQNLFNQGRGQLASATNYGTNFLGNNNVFGNANTAWNQALGGGQAGNIASATSGSTIGALNSFLQGPQNSPQFQDNVNRALGNLSTSFNENVMPGIRSGAAMAGQPGSSREGIAQGLAMGKLADAMGNTASGMYQDAIGQQLQAAQLAGGIAGQAGQTQLGAVGQGQNMFNLGFSPVGAYQQMYNMGWNPLSNYANAVGSPVTLNNSSSSGFNMGLM